VSELVKLRVSQINGCAFCIAYHLKVLRGLGVTQDRLDVVSVWHETALFSPVERAALAWAEDLTRAPMATPRDESYAAVQAHFPQAQLIGLNLSIAGINAWNRLGIAFRFSPADA
jgi:AhpD family alkylhydroperoxidase